MWGYQRGVEKLIFFSVIHVPIRATTTTTPPPGEQQPSKWVRLPLLWVSSADLVTVECGAAAADLGVFPLGTIIGCLLFAEETRLWVLVSQALKRRRTFFSENWKILLRKFGNSFLEDPTIFDPPSFP